MMRTKTNVQDVHGKAADNRKQEDTGNGLALEAGKRNAKKQNGCLGRPYK